MPIFRAEFKNVHNEDYRVEFRLGTNTLITPITLGASPCIIEQKSEGLFSPIKSRSATFEIVSKDYIFELYTPESRGVSAKVYDSDNNVIFNGYVVPNVYDQTYTYLDTISIECVDAVSTLKDFRYLLKESTPIYRPAIEYIYDFVKECGYTGNIYFAKSYDIDETEITFSEANFFYDDEEHQSWTKYDILNEILQFLGVTLTISGNDIYIIDYRISDSTSFNVYSLTAADNVKYTPTTTSVSVNEVISAYAGGTSTLSLDNVFNKIEISDNLFEINEISPDIFEEDLHDSITESRQLGVNGAQWQRQTVKKHWLRADEVSTETEGYQYKIFCKMKEDTNWTHRYYRHSTGIELDDFYDQGSNSRYTTDRSNKYINTQCCVIQHYAYRPNTGSHGLPTSLDWKQYLTFFVVDDTTLIPNIGFYDRLERPVLEYDVYENIMYKPSTGTSWITLKGDIYYQYDGAKYGEKDKTTLRIVGDGVYQNSPVDEATDITEQRYCTFGRTKENSAYLTGFKTWRMKLQIGDKCWDGTRWRSPIITSLGTEEDIYFYLSYNNSPGDGEPEFFSAFKWMSPIPNTDYTDKVGENAYCIPISADDPDAPTSGHLKLSIYTPRILPVELETMFIQYIGNVLDVSWNQIAPVIFVKDFDLGYVYTDTKVWYSQKKNGNSGDVVYTNLISDSYTNEFNDLEFKINTQQKDKPISRSYACLLDGGYLKTRKHEDGDESKDQEKNVIDLYYYHYNTPKVRYGCNIHSFPNGYNRYTFKNSDPINETVSAGTVFRLDSYTYDLLYDNARLELVQY